MTLPPFPPPPPPHPAPNEKILPVGGKVENAIFYGLEKIIQPPPPPPPKENYPPKKKVQSSPVQSSSVQNLIQSSPESSPDFPTGRG